MQARVYAAHEVSIMCLTAMFDVCWLGSWWLMVESAHA